MAKKKAKNPLNQDALDRLHELREKVASTKYGHTVKRAIDSLTACSEAITTRKQALELRYVGPHTAKVIVPLEAGATRPIESKKRKAVDNADNSRRAKPASSDDVAAVADWKPQVSAKQLAYEKAVKEGSSLEVPPGPWKVVLLLDGREQRAEHVQAKLQMSGVPCEQRHLPIGDMAWMARCGDVELMLGTIVERKQVNDLASSLFGTRYLEQRLRLQHCGLPQVLLLVEGNTGAVHNCPADTLHMAMMETRVRLGFQVVATPHLDNTVRFLKNVHRRILQRSFPSAFGDDLPTSLPSFTSPNEPRRKKKKVSLVDMVMDTPPVPPLGSTRCITYNELKARVERDREAGTRTVGAIHAAMLKQMPTLSVKKVQAIQQAYPTPHALYKTYVRLDPSDGKTLVSDFTTNTGRERACRVGPKSAAEVYHMCTEGASADMERSLQSQEAASSSQDGELSGQKESPVPSVARMPDYSAAASVDDSFSFPPSIQDFVTSPPGHDETHVWGSQGESHEWSQVLDSKPAAKSSNGGPPYKRQKSPASPMEEIDLALGQKDKSGSFQDDGFVDLTQDGDSDTQQKADYGLSDDSSLHDATRDDIARTGADMAGVESSIKSSQGSISIDEEEPLYVRCQRLQRAAESKQQGSDDSTNDETLASSRQMKRRNAMEVIEIE